VLVPVILITVLARFPLNIATGSAASGQLLGTVLPALLGTDRARSSLPVRRTVYFLTNFVAVSAVLLFAAQFLTPLLLENEIRTRDTASNVRFVCAPDPTFFGEETSPLKVQPMGNIYVPQRLFGLLLANLKYC
jgi:hypothetical protein